MSNIKKFKEFKTARFKRMKMSDARKAVEDELSAMYGFKITLKNKDELDIWIRNVKMGFQAPKEAAQYIYDLWQNAGSRLAKDLERKSKKR